MCSIHCACFRHGRSYVRTLIPLFSCSGAPFLYPFQAVSRSRLKSVGVGADPSEGKSKVTKWCAFRHRKDKVLYARKPQGRVGHSEHLPDIPRRVYTPELDLVLKHG